jgi:hypothetical protein
MSSTITVQLDALEVLAAELTALAGELSDDADRCAAVAGPLAGGLGGDAGLSAIAAAGAWASLTRVVADGTRTVGVTLSAAVAAYRAADEARVRRLGPRLPEFVAVAW